MDIFLSISGIIVLCIAVIVLAIFVLWIIDRIHCQKLSPEEIAEGVRRFIWRLENPDFNAIEAHYGHSFPEGLKLLYQNKEEVMRNEFEVASSSDSPEKDRWYIAFYEPADMDTVKGAWSGCEKYFSFANDGCGNDYFIDPTIDDPSVKFYDHETGEIEHVCDTFSEFMKWERIGIEE
jgi:hypothetical protein